jgi:glutathione S-transferase
VSVLEVHHWEPCANSGEVLILLKEKGLDFESRYVDVLAFAQHDPAFLKINRRAQVPVLVHDGKVLTETGFILQYIDAVFPDPPLTPSDPHARYWVNVWIKYANEYIAPAVWRLGVSKTHAQLKARATPQALEGLKRAPPERRQAWNKTLAGFSEIDLEIAKALLPLRLQKMEEMLAASDWLAGPGYSLADIVVFPAAASLPALTPDLVNATATPGVMAWFERMKARPAVRAALAMAKTPAPEAVFAPGPEGSRWG